MLKILHCPIILLRFTIIYALGCIYIYYTWMVEIL